LAIDGKCSDCPQYTYPNNDTKKDCIFDACDELSQILSLDGRCEDCPEKTYPDWATNDCVS